VRSAASAALASRSGNTSMLARGVTLHQREELVAVFACQVGD
jgi:hypothetical protein